MSDYQVTTYNVPGSTSTSIQDINDSGEITGIYSDAGGNFYAFTERNGNVQSFNDPNGTNTDPAALNASGTVIGTYVPNDGPTRTGSFVFQNGSFSDIAIPNAGSVLATGINKAGVIVGYYNADTSSVSGDVGFIDSNGQISSFTAPNATDTIIGGINDDGAIFGQFVDAQGNHGFVKTGNAFQVIDAPRSMATEVAGVNDAGEIVGDYQDASGTTHGFVDNNGSFTTIDEPGATFTQINGINSSGQILGVSIDASRTYHVFIYKDGTFTPVTDLGDQGVTFGGPQAINDEGTVVGYDVGPSSVSGFIAATPMPDAVSISHDDTYAHGEFTITGTASSAAGVSSVEISAIVDGARQDLGAATVNTDGTFTFKDTVGDRHAFYVARLTDGAGGHATSRDPGFNHEGGIGPKGRYGRQENFDATEQVSTAIYRPSGQRFLTTLVPGQTVGLLPGDIVANRRLGDTTFVFTPTDGSDQIGGFKIGGPDHDTLALPSSVFANFAAVLRDTKDVNGVATITDPRTRDTITLPGVTTAQVRANPKDFAFRP